MGDRRKRVTARAITALAIAAAVIAEVALALAINVASSTTPWPRLLEPIRRHPWRSSSILIIGTAVLAIATWRLQDPNHKISQIGNLSTDHPVDQARIARILKKKSWRTAGGNIYEIRGKSVQVQLPSTGTETSIFETRGPGAAPLLPSRTGGSPDLTQRLVRIGDVPMAAPAYQQRPGLETRLKGAVAGQIAALVALPGQRGAGKTQLAAALARARMAENWPVVAWINAETKAGMHSGLDELATELGVRDERDTPIKAARRLRRYLESVQQSCLIVFDNAEDVGALRPFLPRSGNTEIVITTTRRAFTRLGGVTVLDVGGFTPTESVLYLEARTQLNDPVGATSVAQELGHLPLGLAQASWVIVSQGLTYGAYLDKLHRQPIEEVLLPDSADDYQLTVVQAISLALDDLDRRNETGARRLLEFLCLLSPDGVPRRYLLDIPVAGFSEPRSIPLTSSHGADGAQQLVEFPALTSLDMVDRALGSLAEASLLLFSEDRNRVIVHRLVAMVVRFLSRDWRIELADRAQTLLSRPGRRGEFSEQTWRRWIDPMNMLPDNIMNERWVDLITALQEGGMQVEWARLNDLAAQYKALLRNVDDQHWALRQEAASWVNEFGLESAIERARDRVTELERNVGRKQLATAYARTHLAYAYWAGGRLDDAINEFRKALPIFRRIHGSRHARTRMISTSMSIAQKQLDSTRLA